MSANKWKLAFMKTPQLIELAWEQAALTSALAERLEMVERERQDLLKANNQPEYEDDSNK